MDCRIDFKTDKLVFPLCCQVEQNVIIMVVCGCRLKVCFLSHAPFPAFHYAGTVVLDKLSCVWFQMYRHVDMDVSFLAQDVTLKHALDNILQLSLQTRLSGLTALRLIWLCGIEICPRCTTDLQKQTSAPQLFFSI